MTSRERVEAALRHREPDRTPYFEYVLLAPLADEFLGRPYGGDPAHWPALLAELGWEGAVRRAAADRLDLAELLGHDMLYVYSTGSRRHGRAGRAAAHRQAATTRWRRCGRATEASRAGAGPARRRGSLIYVCIQEEMARRGVDLPILAPAYGHGVWTDVDLMQTMVLDAGGGAPPLRPGDAALRSGWCRAVRRAGHRADRRGRRLRRHAAAHLARRLPRVHRAGGARACSRRIHAAGRLGRQRQRRRPVAGDRRLPARLRGGRLPGDRPARRAWTWGG